MSNGEKSDVQWNGQAGQLISIDPPGSIVSKILVCYHKSCVTRGIKLFTKDDTCVLQAGEFSSETTEIELAEGERIIGVKTRAGHPHYASYGYQWDWVF